MNHVSQWAEIRHLILVQGVPKREVARRLGVDRKTVDRAVAAEAAPGPRHSPPRGRRLDAYHPRIEAWLREDRRVTAKRIGVLLREVCLLYNHSWILQKHDYLTPNQVRATFSSRQEAAA